MAAYGESQTEPDWIAALQITKRGGTLEQAYATLSSQGVDCELFTVENPEALDQRISLGTPTILGIRVAGPRLLTIYHAVVLVGCIADDYLVNDPAEGVKVLWKRHDLERAVEMAGGWALGMPAV
jgi:hypothetical protein